MHGVRHSYTGLSRIVPTGKMAYAYRGTLVEGEQERTVFVKIASIPPEEAWDFFLTKDRLSRVYGAVMAEYANYANLGDLTCVAKVLDVGLYLSASGPYFLPHPFLVQEFLAGHDLGHLIGTLKESDSTVRADQWQALASKIVNAVSSLHEKSVVHGDLHPCNIIVSDVDEWSQLDDARNAEIKIVDFGTAFLANCALTAPEPFPRNADNFYNAPERRARQENWSLQADIYSVGSILFFLATGETPGIDDNEIDRAGAITRHLVRHNPDLLRDAPAIPKIIAKATATDLTRRYATMAHMRRDLEMVSPRYVPREPPSRGRIKALIEKGAIATNLENPVLREMAVEAFEDLERRLQVLARADARVEIAGDRERIIPYLLQYLTVLERGDEFLAVTTPLLWQSQNLGFNGRFMAMNEIILRRGVSIRRLFLTTAQDRDTEHWKRIVMSHSGMLERVRGGSSANGPPGTADNHGTLELRYLDVAKSEQSSAGQIGHVAGLSRSDNSYTAVSFALDEKDGTVQHLVLWSLPSEIGEAQWQRISGLVEQGTSALGPAMNLRTAH